MYSNLCVYKYFRWDANMDLTWLKVAREKFVDDFSNLAVEKCLLEPLLAIFRPQSVEKLPEETVQAIAAEEEDSKLERARLKEKTSILQRSLAQLRRLHRHNLKGSLTFCRGQC